jgi:4-alpha-glucanotransferase
LLSSRSSGILLHITSLPSRYGIGDLGPSAHRFVDFLSRTEQRIWQILPLGPVGYGASPYSSTSTFAGNPLFISPDRLVDDGWLSQETVEGAPDFPAGRVDYDAVTRFKRQLLRSAFERFETDASEDDVHRFDAFCTRNDTWLDDYALYATLKEVHDQSAWMDWPSPLALRDAEALDEARGEHARTVRKHKFWQYLFNRQWTDLHEYCARRDIRLFGDVPIYVAEDSADVWANQDLFQLDENGRPTVVAGVPPDDYSDTGQRWGNPLYRWDVMADRDYAWWRRRVAHILERVDFVRVDHFRGFASYWEIPAHESTAENGRWVDGPADDLFHALRDEIGTLPVVAEDLGLITPDVTALRDRFDFPGMAVLHFAFGNGPSSSYLPHNYRPNTVAYTGTHDNNTTHGWWNGDTLSPSARQFARDYLNLPPDEDPEMHWQCIRFLMASVADRVIVPLQDVLGLGGGARMNNPGGGTDNWSWRYTDGALTDDIADRLTTLTRVYGRALDDDDA